MPNGTVLGAEVAAALGYRLGQPIVIAHGSGDVAFALHKDHPFRVVGILARTGTPVDRAIHVSLEGMDAVHAAESAEAAADPLAAAMQKAKQREAQSAGRNDQDRDQRSWPARRWRKWELDAHHHRSPRWSQIAQQGAVPATAGERDARRAAYRDPAGRNAAGCLGHRGRGRENLDRDLRPRGHHGARAGC